MSVFGWILMKPEILLGGIGGAIAATIINIVYNIFVRRIEFKRAYFLEIIRQRNRVYESIIQELLAVQDLLSWSQYPHGAEKLLESRTKWMDMFDIVIPKSALYIEPDVMSRLDQIRSEMETEKWELMNPDCAKALYNKLKNINNRFIEEMNYRLNDIEKAIVHRHFKRAHVCRSNGQPISQYMAQHKSAKKGSK